MQMATQILYPATAEKVADLRSLLTSCGVNGARVRRMANGAARLVLASRDDRDAARDALVLANARTATGCDFTNPDSRFAWNGPVEIFVRFGS
jgi:hypothetical protein